MNHGLSAIPEEASKAVRGVEPWTAAGSPRIFRSPAGHFNGDEPREAEGIYDDATLSGIAAHGFNGIWIRGRLYDLMRSSVLPQLERPDRDRRLESLRRVIERAARHGIGVYLYFNEPLALRASHRIWEDHPELRGTHIQHAHTLDDELTYEKTFALCSSHPTTRAFFRDAVRSVVGSLPGLAGLILITASERFSHCWSHLMRIPLPDGIDRGVEQEPNCPRCRDREPAELVLGLLTEWRDAARELSPGCRVLAWNWSWSIWYPDPQAEIVARLPEGVELLLDWERGGEHQTAAGRRAIDEYALSYPGPGGRFLGSRAAAPDGTPIHAKLQLGTTHEIATVPNLPLLQSIHHKLSRMSELGVAGTVACWNFGCTLTLNTYAVKKFLESPTRYADAEVFLDELAADYFGLDFGLDEVAGVRSAWRSFDEAFGEHFPFSMRFVYWAPTNDAPAHPLSLDYRKTPLGICHLPHPFGDDASSCLDRGTSIQQVAEQLGLLTARWEEGVERYREALAGKGRASQVHAQRRGLELSCAEMIGHQMRSTANFFRFHQRRLELAGGRDEAGRLPADPGLLAVMREEMDNARAALPLVEADARLGFHQESHVWMYDAEKVRQKLAKMQGELDEVGGGGGAGR